MGCRTNMGGESEATWRSVLDRPIARGLQTPKLPIIDGPPGWSGRADASHDPLNKSEATPPSFFAPSETAPLAPPFLPSTATEAARRGNPE